MDDSENAVAANLQPILNPPYVPYNTDMFERISTLEWRFANLEAWVYQMGMTIRRVEYLEARLAALEKKEQERHSE